MWLVRRSDRGRRGGVEVSWSVTIEVIGNDSTVAWGARPWRGSGHGDQERHVGHGPVLVTGIGEADLYGDEGTDRSGGAGPGP